MTARSAVPGSPLVRAALVALAMTAALGVILGQRAMRVADGVEITLTSVPMASALERTAGTPFDISGSLSELAIPISAASPARAALLADRDGVVLDGWVSLKPGPDGQLEAMRVSATHLRQQPGEVVLRAAYRTTTSEDVVVPRLLIQPPGLARLNSEEQVWSRFNAQLPVDVVLSVTPDGRSVLRRVVQGDVVLVEAPGLL